MRPADLPATWRALADEFRALAAEPQARALEKCATELEAALADTAAELLTLDAAAEASGFSTRQLRHLIASGQLENVGRKHAPRLRRGDLPKAPARASSAGLAGPGGGFDPDAFALSLHARRKRPA